MIGFYHKDDTYLGDGLYLSVENNTIILYAWNCVDKPKCAVYLEPEVYNALLKSVYDLTITDRLRGFLPSAAIPIVS